MRAMKAGVKVAEGPGNFEVKQVPVPSLGDGDVLIQIKTTGVCGTDVLIYDWAYRGRSPVRPPLVLGHEGAGVVAELGKNVKGLKVGDKVGTEAIVGCGSCYYCRQGRFNHCPQWDHIGVTFNGTFAEYLKVPASIIHRLPENVSLEEGSLLEPLSIAVNAIDHIKISLGDNVAIVGPGTLGLLLVQAVRCSGASKLVVLGLAEDKFRLEKTKELGADLTLFVDQGDPVKEVLEMTHGMGLDGVIEAGGTTESFNLAFKLVRAGGQIAVLGYGSRGEVAPITLARQEICMCGVTASIPKNYEQALRWLETKKVTPEAIISHRLGLDEAEKGIHLMRDKAASKVCLIP
jgi:threonine dehydrogenase-like Zn-dependent dehydrogenase